MTVEDRLRQAIEARTSTVEPSLDEGLDRITTRLGRPEGSMRSPRAPWLLMAAAIVLIAAAGGLLLANDDDTGQLDTIGQPNQPDRPDRPETTRSTDTTAAPDTTEATPTSEASDSELPPSGDTPTTGGSEDAPVAPADVVDQAMWPRPSSEVRFDDPVAAARSFAVYVAQFEDPVVGEFRQGDSRSGEVSVQPFENAPATEVLVRRLSDDNWYVIGSLTEDITVDQPASGVTLSSPQPLSGQALAFEGHVQVQLLGYRPDGRSERLALSYVTGSGAPPAGPFTGSLDWSRGSAELEPTGVVVFWTTDESLEVGGSLQVVAIPVRLQD